MLISVARWLLCIVAIAAVLAEWAFNVDHPIVWVTLCCVFVALQIVGRKSP